MFDTCGVDRILSEENGMKAGKER